MVAPTRRTPLTNEQIAEFYMAADNHELGLMFCALAGVAKSRDEVKFSIEEFSTIFRRSVTTFMKEETYNALVNKVEVVA